MPGPATSCQALPGPVVPCLTICIILIQLSNNENLALCCYALPGPTMPGLALPGLAAHCHAWPHYFSASSVFANGNCACAFSTLLLSVLYFCGVIMALTAPSIDNVALCSTCFTLSSAA